MTYRVIEMRYGEPYRILGKNFTKEDAERIVALANKENNIYEMQQERKNGTVKRMRAYPSLPQVSIVFVDGEEEKEQVV